MRMKSNVKHNCHRHKKTFLIAKGPLQLEHTPESWDVLALSSPMETPGKSQKKKLCSSGTFERIEAK